MRDSNTLRSTLEARPDVANADIDEVLAIAARRQDEARRDATSGATLAELEAVARELDIAPEHVEAAIAELGATRAASATAAAAAEAARAARRAQVLRGLGAAAVVAVASALFAFGAGASGAASVREASVATEAAEARLDAVLERQASLAPQLAGLAGAQDDALLERAAAVRTAVSVAERLIAVDALTAAMATRLGALPPPSGDAEATLRLQLHDELTGSQNRVTVELRRYREAEAAWRAAAASGLGGFAVTLGMAEAPPRE